jgi:universal stress protein G
MYKTILVPVDVSEQVLTNKAVTHALYLANQSDGDVHFVTVIPGFSPELTRGFISDAKVMEKHFFDSATEKLLALANTLDYPRNKVHTHVCNGHIRDEINHMADELNADIIVVGSRNPGIKTHLLGSSAANIIRYSRVPVLVVR